MVEQKSSVFSRLGVTKIVPVAAPLSRAQLQGVKSRLGSRITLTGAGEDSDVLADTVPVAFEADPETHVSVHSRLGPRRSSGEDNSTVKKRKFLVPTLLSRPTMVADELEIRKPTGIHARLTQSTVTLSQGRPALGKRSVVFQQLH